MAESKKQIALQLELHEVNTILKALGNLPFMEVYRIIEKIHVQAAGAAEPQTPGKVTKPNTKRKR